MMGFQGATIVAVRYFMLVALWLGPVTRGFADEPLPEEKSSTAATETGQADESYEFEKLTDVEYAKHGQVALLADLFVPKQQGSYPGVLVVHGGAWRHGSKERCGRVAAELVKRGYSVMAINYRLAPQHKFPAQLEDCVAALTWFHQNATKCKVDTTRIGAWGYSAGGQLVALLGATLPKERAGENGAAEGKSADVDESATRKAAGFRLQAVVAGGAPTDFRNWLPAESKILTYWLGQTRAERPDLYEQASPRHYSSEDDPPMFFFHGENDAIVPSKFGRAMVADLKSLGVHAVFHLVPDKGHVLARFDQAAQLASFAFLDQQLKAEEQQDNKSNDRTDGPQDRSRTTDEE